MAPPDRNGDLTSTRAILAKGWLFLVIGILASALLIARDPDWRAVLLLAVAVWGFCRFYFFAFHVIERWVDPTYRFAGLLDFFRWWWRERPAPRVGHSSSDRGVEKPETD